MSLISLRDVTVVREGAVLLDVDSYLVEAGERWVLLGPNGSGKSTLLAVATGRLWPTTGDVHLLGNQLGRVDLRQLKGVLGLMSSSLAKQLRPSLSVRDVVVSGIDGALEPWWRQYSTAEIDLAEARLEDLGVRSLADRPFGVISDGERANVLLARALMSSPRFLCLDEPAAGLDLGARERLLGRLSQVTGDFGPEGVVLVTHHLEEIPSGMTHAALLGGGSIALQGPIEEVLDSESVSSVFATPVQVARHADGRFSARSADLDR
jgi:iron complex transport system ATP-binding protein